MLVSSAAPIITWTFSLTSFSLKNKKKREKFVRIIAILETLHDCFMSMFLWKETLSFQYSIKDNSYHIVEKYFQRIMGERFKNVG